VSTTEELLGRKSKGSGVGILEYGHGDPSRWLRGNSIHTFGTNFDDKRRSLGRYSSLGDSGHVAVTAAGTCSCSSADHRKGKEHNFVYSGTSAISKCGELHIKNIKKYH
jgi:hypothetical protein